MAIASRIAADGQIADIRLSVLNGNLLLYSTELIPAPQHIRVSWATHGLNEEGAKLADQWIGKVQEIVDNVDAGGAKAPISDGIS